MKTKMRKYIPLLILTVSGCIYLKETIRTPWALVVFILGMVFKRTFDHQVLDPALADKHWTTEHALRWARRECTELNPRKCRYCNPVA